MKTLAVLLALVSCGAFVCANTEVASKPNIVVFFADDLGYGDVSFNGHPTIRSPNLDKLAAEGMRMSSFYSGAPICSPSRASILTGRLPIRNGVYTQSEYPLDQLFRVFYPWSTGSLPDTEITIAEALKPANYTSGLIGKWHLGHVDALPLERGFDYFYGLPYSQDEGCPPGYGMNCTKEWQHIWPGVPLYRNDTIIQQPVNLQTLVPRYTAEANGFIEQAVVRDKPFFLYMAYDEVHVPLFASPEFTGVSKRGLFGDAVQEMDDSIGQIMAKLDEVGVLENTLVFFTSDNGPWVDQGIEGGSAGLFRGEKGETWEGGMREPAIIYWKGKIQGGQLNMDMTSTMDIFSTALDVAGVPAPTDRVIDGVSLLPLILNGKPVERDCYFYYRDHTLQAARCGAFKAHYVTRCGFCHDPPTWHNPPLLFNVNEDPGEQWELDPTDYQSVLQDINNAVAKHNSTMVKGVPQLNLLNPFVAPCCDHSNRCNCGNDMRQFSADIQ
eukprot:TRINITY_DN6869_c0_g1_i1.p1 TRINITY_DN6869_c0_g1~~TRINITY_DN6869_c0_g1_i1.p1  ORF type:complete len:511 (-),score=111.70 TRINITY_DN6869_c0_g1_i1:61-1551(-)